jgi:hypothetical protein
MIDVKGAALVLMAVLVLIAACQKDGELQMAPQVTEGRLKVFSANPDSRFSIAIDDVNLADSLTSGRTITRTVVKADGPQHFVVRDIITNTTMVDTMLVLNRPFFELSVIQYDPTPGSKPLVITGGTSEIAEDSARIAFYLEDITIETPIDVYLYKSNTWVNTLDTTPIYIYRNVKQFAATEFATVPITDSIGFSVVIKNSATGQPVEGIANNFVLPEDAFSGITLGLCAAPGSGVPTNINSLLTLGPAWEGSEFWAGLCKVSF